MTDNKQEATGHQLCRRKLLAAGVSAATALTGVTAITGTAAAWTTLKAEFDGCSEVSIIVGEQDLDFEKTEGNRYGGDAVRPPLVVDVVLADESEVHAEQVEITSEVATTMPGQHGGRPVVRFRARDGKRILGVIGNSPSREPLKTATIVNTNRCARIPGMPSIEASERYQNRK